MFSHSLKFKLQNREFNFPIVTNQNKDVEIRMYYNQTIVNAYTPISEFIDDLKWILPSEINGNLLKEIVKSLDRCLKNHSNLHKRILEDDLDIFICESIMVYLFLNEEINNLMVEEHNKSKLFYAIKEEMSKRYSNELVYRDLKPFIFDDFEPYLNIKMHSFEFLSSEYKVWKNAKIIDSDKCNINVNFCPEDLGGKKVMKVEFNHVRLHQHMIQHIYFHKLITHTDRLMLLNIPAEVNAYDSIGLNSLRLNINPTTRFGLESNEPYCCSLYLKDQYLERISFSFNYPEKMIELESFNRGKTKFELHQINDSNDVMSYLNKALKKSFNDLFEF